MKNFVAAIFVALVVGVMSMTTVTNAEIGDEVTLTPCCDPNDPTEGMADEGDGVDTISEETGSNDRCDTEYHCDYAMRDNWHNAPKKYDPIRNSEI